MTFASASSQIFRETSGSVVLIAVEVVFSANDAPDSLTASESRVLLNPGQSLIVTEWMQCYVIADDLARVFKHGICPDELVHDELSRRGGVPTVLNPLADTFIVPHPDAVNDTQDDSEMRSMTAYAQLATPSFSPGKLDKPSAQSTIQKRQNIVSTCASLLCARTRALSLWSSCSCVLTVTRIFVALWLSLSLARSRQHSAMSIESVMLVRRVHSLALGRAFGDATHAAVRLGTGSVAADSGAQLPQREPHTHEREPVRALDGRHRVPRTARATHLRVVRHRARA